MYFEFILIILYLFIFSLMIIKKISNEFEYNFKLLFILFKYYFLIFIENILI